MTGDAAPCLGDLPGADFVATSMTDGPKSREDIETFKSEKKGCLAQIFSCHKLIQRQRRSFFVIFYNLVDEGFI